MDADHELIEPLGGDERFRLERGRRPRTAAPLLVKTPRHQPPPAADVAALRRERDLIAGLPIAGVLQPRIVESPPGCALVMEDPGGRLLSSRGPAAAGPDLGWILAIGRQLAATLGEMHRRRMRHNGVRPDAILCDAARARAWLIDFSDANDGLAPPHVAPTSAVRLTYAAPEQSGRLTRTADHRSDLYSLGVVLYELLTGAPPFRSDDALELIHGHIAEIPPAPAEIDAAIAPPVSDIVMKLLAKNPDERYQSAAGLVHDLTVCAQAWAECGSIAPFALGARDVGDHVSISPKLYGREREVGVLLEAFERTRAGRERRPSMLLVTGYAGIGKTSLIQELYKPIVRRRGYFISGKFDQVVRSIPYGALIQAFRGLVRQLLTESEVRLESWRSTLVQALGANGGVLAEVIPEIELVIGEQAPPVPLGPLETLNRFQRVLRNFVAALAQPSHPLVVFLDDLQWADAATLGLLEPLLTDREIRSLLLIGAYRDNELDDAHRLTRTLGALEATGVEPQRIALGPLALSDLSLLVGDTLRGDEAHAEPLARLVFEKTAGNPFFVIQFLKTLERDGHLRFDQTQGRWVYRIDAIADAPLADNVIDLMTRNIQRLPTPSQYALTLAACIGSRFELRTLAIISQRSQEAAADDLAPAIAEGLILPLAHRHVGSGGCGPEDGEDDASAYAFLHDRVQQSAYALIPAERKPMLHLSIGRLLRARTTPQQAEHALFDIVHHLNLGRSLIADDAQRLEVAGLNLNAGRRAKSSTAHDAALGYFEAGLNLLGEQHWASQYELSFALHLEAAESLYLCGNFDAAQDRLARLLRRAATAVDRARVYRLRSVQYENLSRYADALASAREGLALFGVTLPESATEKRTALEREIAAITSLLGDRSVASLVDLPVMTDPEIRIVMNTLTDIWASTYLLGDPTLARLISATLVRLSLEHGNVEESAYGYVTHAITVGPVRGDYRTAYEFGRLALGVNHRFDDSRLRAKIYQQFHAHVNFWRQPMATCARYAREACRSGLESGDFLYAAYGAGTEPWSAIVATQDLAQFVRDYTPNVALIERLKNRGFADSVKILLNWARALQGQTAAPLSLSDASIDEGEYLRTYRDKPFFATIHGVAKLHVCCLLGQAEDTLHAARQAGRTVHHLLGTVWPLIFDFWNALALAANYGRAAEGERRSYLARLRATRASFDVLAENCPENFLCQSLLLAAEIERLEGRDHAALELYQRAIEYAERPGMIQQQALANELCAGFQLQRGQTAQAASLLAEARACYARWGASAKVEQLERQYAGLLAPRAVPRGVGEPPAAPAPPGNDAIGLDLFSLVKAAQAIAGEVEMDQLLARLMRIALENAGAERGCLVLESDGGSIVYVADASSPVSQGIALAESQSLPASIVNYVRRTADSVVLADALADDRHGGDPYIVLHKPLSVLCVPVQKQGRLIGSLYLENRLVRGAFTPQRIRIMQVLSAEAAIALDNARLFDGLRREIRERRQAQEQLGTALAELERLKDALEAENVYLRRDLIANVSHDLRTPLVSLRGYLEILCAKGDSLPLATRSGYLEIALRQSEHLATLIDELFELAKLDFKGLKLDRETFQFAELASDVLQKFRLAAEGKQVTLRLDAPAALPLVHADLGLIERVLDNLIGNALRHTPGGGSVSVRVRSDGARVIVSVVDTGSGIPTEDLPFVFERFYRADKSRNRACGGAGLGLAIARRIVELHGSDISVESAVAAGSCFSFSLPVDPVS